MKIRGFVIALGVVAGAALGFSESSWARQPDESTTIRQCFNGGQWDEVHSTCQCVRIGTHANGSGGCDLDPPFGPAGQTPNPWTPPPGEGPGSGGGGAGGGGPTVPHGPTTKACTDCKKTRQDCQDHTDDVNQQCQADIQNTAEALCRGPHPIGANGHSYPPTVSGSHDVPPCLIFEVETRSCDLWSVKVDYTWNPDCYNTYIDGFSEPDTENGGNKWTNKWHDDHVKECNDDHEHNVQTCNHDNPCETTVCKGP